MRLAGAALVVLFGCGCYCQAIIVQPSGPASTATAAVPPAGHDIVALLGIRKPKSRPSHRILHARCVGRTQGQADRHSCCDWATAERRFPVLGSQVQQLFGDALAALPPAPRHFLLYFANGSDQLTAASEKLLPVILVFVKNRAVPDVTVVGHTDTTGAAPANVEFGRRRATTIRDRLVAAGLDAGIVSVASHGEAELQVPTPNDTPEPKNRFVDVSVR